MNQLTVNQHDVFLLKTYFTTNEEIANKTLSILIALTNMIEDEEEEPDCHTAQYFLATTARDLLADVRYTSEMKDLFTKMGL